MSVLIICGSVLTALVIALVAHSAALDSRREFEMRQSEQAHRNEMERIETEAAHVITNRELAQAQTRLKELEQLSRWGVDDRLRDRYVDHYLPPTKVREVLIPQASHNPQPSITE